MPVKLLMFARRYLQATEGQQACQQLPSKVARLTMQRPQSHCHLRQSWALLDGMRAMPSRPLDVRHCLAAQHSAVGPSPGTAISHCSTYDRLVKLEITSGTPVSRLPLRSRLLEHTTHHRWTNQPT